MSTVHVKERGDGLFELVLDQPDRSANVLDQATLAELDATLDALPAGARGLLVSSAKNGIFVAGADVRELAALESEAEVRSAVERGQEVFLRFAALKFPTVALIHGSCLGGGLELALALDWRIASDSAKTRIGFPEVHLGILPAWGGTSRLTRLVGVPAALGLILGAKQLRARRALRAGLIDEVVPRELLLHAGQTRLRSRLPRRKRHWLTRNRLVAGLIGKRARATVLATTRGHYPAPLRVIDVVTGAAHKPLAASLRAERDAVAALATAPACRNLMHLFFLRERARHLDPAAVGLGSAPQHSGIGATAVIGAGAMGSGIAQWLAARGLPVILRDLGDEALARGMASIERLFANAVRRGVFDRRTARDSLDRIHPSAADVPLQRTDLVVEAAVEELASKRRILLHLETLTRPDTILATNTSSLSVDNLAAELEHPGRVVGLHFFNPVHRMELVEIVVADRTDPSVAARAVRFVQEIGKLPVVVRDRPGFCVNRILFPYLAEAGRMFDGGVPPGEIDAAMLDFGMPMGPLRLLDEVGLDIALHVARHLEAEFGERLETPRILERMADAGFLGRKQGTGFYRYDGKRPRVNEAARRLAESAGRDAAHRRDDLTDRMVLLLLGEAARCIEETVVAAPQDVDLAMVAGAGFAPFRGGPLRYADTLGARQLVDRLRQRTRHDGPRFEPARLLQSMAAVEGGFYER